MRKPLSVKKMMLAETLKELTHRKSGILATNFYNLETLYGILGAAKLKGSPLILQLTKGSIDYMGLETAVSLASDGLKKFGVEGWIHLDHGDSLELIHRCLDAGFDSIMIDGSELPFRENINITRKAVKIAEKYRANVEGELGYVAKLGQPIYNLGFTNPEDSRVFVEETGINALAVSIGTAHGFYTQVPNLQLDLLASIASQIGKVALVLHGSSGLPDQKIREAIDCGICKINLATEIKETFMKTLQDCFLGNYEIDLRKVFPKAIHAVSELVSDKLEVVRNGN